MDFSHSFLHFLYGVLLMRIFLVVSIISALRFIVSHHSGYSALFGALVVVVVYSNAGTGDNRVAPAFTPVLEGFVQSVRFNYPEAI